MSRAGQASLARSPQLRAVGARDNASYDNPDRQADLTSPR